MSVWSVVWKVVDTLLGVAIRADELAERRRVRKKLDALGEAMSKDEARRASQRAPTVVIRRPRPPS
jgi:hypothetical protein